MSVNQVRQCVGDVMGIDPKDTSLDWQAGKLKKLTNTTTTLYNISLNKVMLKQSEEIARCHICAYIAAEKYTEKYEPELQYYSEKVPLEPKKFSKIVGLFKQSLWQSTSPTSSVKEYSGAKSYGPDASPSRFSAIDPAELREQLFRTPRVANASSPRALRGDINLSPDKPVSPTRTNPRRKLAFEEDEEEDGATYRLSSSPMKSPRRSIFRDGIEPDPEDTDFDSPMKSPMRSPSKSASTSPRKKRGEYNKWNMLYKKYYRITIEEIIGLCNQFEIPSKVAFMILDCFGMHATYLVYPAQLVCGLVMICCFTIYNQKRTNNPEIDDYLLQKMCSLMRSNDTNDVLEAIKITKELIDGEKWYRDLKVEYDCYDGADFNNNIAVRLGNMLQNTNLIVSDEQFTEWKKKILMDISLRDSA
ncbi:HCL430Cp [Eremothecium sinecaudum]|uniref:HCL430Cp n=1 Tax=Eremothecium sinecaudum TaxID=45286 RepID=A0A109UY62_9SACH|nr:HCL430Cp [Eremothecium sinecaudum]AMD19721.1 HCL430Cp [Eremothecium sinecaudum]